MALLSDQPDIKASFTYDFDEKMLKSSCALAPRIVLVDARLNGNDSLRVIQRVRTHFPAANVIVMNLPISQSKVIEFVKAGVSGFILEGASSVEHLATIRSVAHGTIVLPPDLTETLFSNIVVPTGRKLESRDLTKREVHVSNLVALGQSNRQIAVSLKLSVHTIKSHVHNILGKLGLRTRLELAREMLAGDLMSGPRTATPSNRRGINRRD
jgi:two-component system response regulator NreC